MKITDYKNLMLFAWMITTSGTIIGMEPESNAMYRPNWLPRESHSQYNSFQRTHPRDFHNRASAQSNETPPLILEMQHGTYENFQAMIDAGYDVNCRSANGKTPLIHAALHNKGIHLTSLLCLSDQDVDPDLVNIDGYDAWIYAQEIDQENLKSNRATMTRQLEQYRAERLHKIVNRSTGLPMPECLVIADYYGDTTGLASGQSVLELVRYGSSQGIQRTRRKNANRKQLQLLKHNVDSGSDVNTQDENGITAAMHACNQKHKITLLKTIVKSEHFDPDLADKTGKTIIEHAKQRDAAIRKNYPFFFDINPDEIAVAIIRKAHLKHVNKKVKKHMQEVSKDNTNLHPDLWNIVTEYSLYQDADLDAAYNTPRA